MKIASFEAPRIQARRELRTWSTEAGTVETEDAIFEEILFVRLGHFGGR
jgi:hypothetical protein